MTSSNSPSLLRALRHFPVVLGGLALVVSSCARGQRGKLIASPAPVASALASAPRQVHEKASNPVFELSSPEPLLAEGASLKEVSGALADVRARGAGCPEFNRLGPRVMNTHGPQLRNPCGVGATHVRCLETPAGYYVPVSVKREICIWNLWFVPRDRARAPVHGPEDYEEFDLQYTSDFVLDDFEGKGVQEALVTRGWEHPEGVSFGTQVVRHLPDGRILPTNFDAVRDVDGDGLLDGIISFQTQLSEVCDAQGEPWARAAQRGPTLVFHRLRNREFALNDPLALAARAKPCQNSDGPLVALQGSSVNEDETVQRAVCQVARGRSRKAVWAEIEQRCRTVLDSTLDCPHPRPFACALPNYLPNWLERVEAAAGMPPLRQ